MREGWEIRKLGDLADLQRGLTYSKGDEVPFSSKRVLRSNNIDLERSKLDLTELKYLREDFAIPEDRKVKKNSIFICMSNGSKQHVGKVAFIDEDIDYAFGGFMGLIVPKSGIVPKYVFFACQSSAYRLFLSSIGNGIGITNLRFTDLANYSIPVPPIQEQERIVAELDSLSGIIEKKKQQLEEMDRLAQSIFYDMFGDPIVNEKGWETSNIGSFCTDVRYGTSRPACDGGKFVYLRMGNLTYEGSIDLTDIKHIDIPDNEIEKCIVRKGDVLFNRTNSLDLVGKTCLFDLDEEMVIAGYIIRVRLNRLVLPVYLVRTLNTSRYKKVFRALAKGAVNQANINAKEFQSVVIPVPPLNLQEHFAKKIEAIEKEKELVKQSILETETLFNSRMDYWFN